MELKFQVDLQILNNRTCSNIHVDTANHYVEKSAWKGLGSWHAGLLSIFKEDGERPLPYSAYGHLVSDPCTLPCLCLMLQS